MNYFLNWLRSIRVSNLIFIFFLPFIIYFIAISRNYGKALGAAALFSILTEDLQLLVPWRHGDFMDPAANILGVGLAGIMVKSMHSLKKTI